LKFLLLIKFTVAVLLGTSLVQAQTLKGSSRSIEHQYQAAVSYGYAFVDTAHSVKQHVNSTGQLVRVKPDRYLELHDVSYPYAVPGTKLFLNRLSNQYHNACGEKLTVTSLLRPRDRQPANSVARSVHPTGMAVDMRVPRTHKCRAWLEKTLLSLEKDRVLDVTRERRPPHYHVAVFVKNYEKRLGLQSRPAPTQLAAHSAPGQKYAVRRGDTLSEIADMNGVSITRLRAANALRGNRIYEGQKLLLPGQANPLVAANKMTHRVNRGDTLSEIAAMNGVSITRLRAANALRGNRIYAGQKLLLPSQGNQLLVANGTTHRVNRGDTLWRIANLYGTSVKQLRRVNGQTGDSLQIGQVLRISKS
jgi:LysM repeat protein